MIPFERCDVILKAAKNSNFISINELLNLTGSSLTTLRRDINYLEKQGKIEKIRGGIVCIEKSDSDSISYLYENREKLYSSEKDKIGIAAQQFIENTDVLFLTYGTTTAQVAKHIDDNKTLTVITNGIDIVSSLKNKPNIEVILLGGIMDYSYNVIVGPTVSRMLENFNPSKIIMGAGGISEEKGITGYNYLNSSFLKRVIDTIETKIVVVDHTKFDRNTLLHIAPLDKIDVIITSKSIPKHYTAVFDKYNIESFLV